MSDDAPILPYRANPAGWNFRESQRLDDGVTDSQPTTDPSPSSTPPPLIIERAPPGIEIELTGGRRLRFDRDADPDMVRRMVCALGGGTP